jgi:hypothetical protein
MEDDGILRRVGARQTRKRRRSTLSLSREGSSARLGYGVGVAAMFRLYDFRDQEQKIAAIQRTSLTHETLGLAPVPLVASDDWWAQIASGAIPTGRVDGVITRVYWASMADWPEFERQDARGQLSSWTREGDARRFVEGLTFRLEYVEHPWKHPRGGEPGVSRLVLGQWIEESPQRSAGIAPGPGGAGYALAREHHGDATHYLYAPSRIAGEQLLGELERQGRIGRVWGGGTRELWIVQIGAAHADLAKAEASQLAKLALSYGARYDGGEIVQGEVWGPIVDGAAGQDRGAS